MFFDGVSQGHFGGCFGGWLKGRSLVSTNSSNLICLDSVVFCWWCQVRRFVLFWEHTGGAKRFREVWENAIAWPSQFLIEQWPRDPGALLYIGDDTTQLYEEYNKSLLHKDSYEPVSMMECHMRVLNYSIEMFPSFCHGSKRKKLWKIPWHRKFLLEILHSCRDKLSFWMPQNHRQPLCQFHVWHPQRCKNLAPPKKSVDPGRLPNRPGVDRYFCLFEEAFGGIRICKTAGLCSCPSHGN